MVTERLLHMRATGRVDLCRRLTEVIYDELRNASVLYNSGSPEGDREWVSSCQKANAACEALYKRLLLLIRTAERKEENIEDKELGDANE